MADASREIAERSGPARFRAQLHSTMTAAAGPYGYTISLGGSIAVATQLLAPPHLSSAILLMVGAVLAFVLLEASTRGSSVDGGLGAEGAPSVWGNAHIPSAGGAICAAWAVAHAAHAAVGWALVGFVATATYFSVTAAQRIATAAVRARLRR